MHNEQPLIVKDERTKPGWKRPKKKRSVNSVCTFKVESGVFCSWSEYFKIGRKVAQYGELRPDSAFLLRFRRMQWDADEFPLRSTIRLSSNPFPFTAGSTQSSWKKYRMKWLRSQKTSSHSPHRVIILSLKLALIVANYFFFLSATSHINDILSLLWNGRCYNCTVRER